MMQDAKNAKVAFHDCVEFYGDSPEATDTNTFFAILVRFNHRWKETVEVGSVSYYCRRKVIKEATAFSYIKQRLKRIASSSWLIFICPLKCTLYMSLYYITL